MLRQSVVARSSKDVSRNSAKFAATFSSPLSKAAVVAVAVCVSACGSGDADSATSGLDPASDSGAEQRPDAASSLDAGPRDASSEGTSSRGASSDDDDQGQTAGDGTPNDGRVDAGSNASIESASSGDAPAASPSSNVTSATTDALSDNESSATSETSPVSPASSQPVGSSSDGFDTSDGSDTSAQPPIQAAEVVTTAALLMQEAHFPGMALATFDATGVTWSVGMGYADSGLQRPITPDTSFWLASVTKPFTGLAILRATEQTALSLNTQVNSLLEDNGKFSLASEAAADTTIADLVTHRSPIRDSNAYLCGYYVGTEAEHTSLANLLELGIDCDEEQPVDLGGFLQSYLSAEGGYYSPGNFDEAAAGFAYSNVGSALAGYAVELATTKSLAEYSREQLFAPLGLEHTSFTLADLNPTEVATPTRWDTAALTFVDYPIYELATWPDGGLRSSVNDLSKLCAALLAGGTLGETTILGSESVAIAFSPLASADSGDVGVFWMVGDDASYAADGSTRRLAGHNGGDPGAATMVVLDLDNDFGIVILANGELSDQQSAEGTNELARLLYRFAEQQANAH